jgi:hypothetical protein
MNKEINKKEILMGFLTLIIPPIVIYLPFRILYFSSGPYFLFAVFLPHIFLAIVLIKLQSIAEKASVFFQLFNKNEKKLIRLYNMAYIYLIVLSVLAWFHTQQIIYFYNWG